MNFVIWEEVIIICLIVVFIIKLRKVNVLLNSERELNKTLKYQNEYIKKSNELKHEMLIRVSHDMRTPISNIVMIVELLKNNADNVEKVTKYLKKMENSSQYLLGLSNDIIDMRKVELKTIQIENENINMKNVILESLALVEDKIKEKNIKITRKIDKLKHLNLIGDKLRLKRIFVNILVNAINHTPSGGKIIFSAKEIKYIDESESGGRKVNIEFKISDNGEGMKKEFLEHIWEPYSKDNSSCYKNIGTGLGMAITKQYIVLMNGEISVKSKIGVGSIFTINLTFDENIKKTENKLVEKIA